MPEHIKKKLEEEIKQLERELHHELPKEIRTARAHGDLSENAEYHMAKQRQSYVDARLAQLKQRMAELSMVNLDNLPKDKAAFGSRVVVYDGDKDELFNLKDDPGERKDLTAGEPAKAEELLATADEIGRILNGLISSIKNRAGCFY